MIKVLNMIKDVFLSPPRSLNTKRACLFPNTALKNIISVARPQWPACLCSSVFTRRCDFLAISRNYSRSSWKWFEGNSLKSGSVTAVEGSSQGRILALSTILDINSPREQSHARAGVRPPTGRFSSYSYHRWVHVQRHSQ